MALDDDDNEYGVSSKNGVNTNQFQQKGGSIETRLCPPKKNTTLWRHVDSRSTVSKLERIISQFDMRFLSMGSGVLKKNNFINFFRAENIFRVLFY
ncbi:MAG: hypothetical protein K2X63_04805 [Burkholderiaceae bacterium]|nr:hypothetical protein [Burkholderiaceae bacterium]